jgi:hypothetical protein
MADFSVREMSIEDYEKLLQQPQNAVFAKVLLGARMAESDTRIAKAAKKIAEERAKQKAEEERAKKNGATQPAKAAAETSSRPGPGR